MKRLTAYEVETELLAQRAAYARNGEGNAATVLHGAACLVRDNLIPQWQDEPSGDGWYWVEGFELPYQASIVDGKCLWFCNGYLVEIFNRRVCLLGERPKQ